jgi:hypothetical protein
MPKYFALFSILPMLLKTIAYAQTPASSPEPTIWDHNGSVMSLVANGSSREFYYQKPRPGMFEAGARPGSLLFRGQADNGQYSGTAYMFNPRCGQIPFQVRGAILDNDERLVLTGQAPQVGRNCQTYASYTTNLEFRLLRPVAVHQSEEAPAMAQTPSVEESKPELSSTDGGGLNLPSSPTAQPSVANGTHLAAKDPSTSVVERNPPSTTTPQSSVTNESPFAGQDLDTYLWAAVLIMMIGLLLGFSIGTFSEVFRRKR